MGTLDLLNQRISCQWIRVKNILIKECQKIWSTIFMKSKTLKKGAFNKTDQSWSELTPDRTDSFVQTNTVKLITYNVWFSDKYVGERSKVIFQILNESDADIIALQEVTYHFLQLLLMQDWVQKDYFISDFKGNTFGAYGVVLLSRFPVKRLGLYQLPSDMERQLLLAEFIINNKTLKLATVHLESMQDSADIRAEQLETIFPLLDEADNSVLMGDFNFCSSNLDENLNIDGRYDDLWEELRPKEIGYTLNSEINNMLTLNLSTSIQARYDRILFRQDKTNWKCIDIKLLGDKPIPDLDVGVFPSDHFGLLAILDC